MHNDGNNHRGGHLYAVVFSLCVLFTAGSGPAMAADWLDDVPLRGAIPAGQMRWDGVYFGAHGGWTSLNTSFSGAATSIVAHILRNTTVEDEFSPSSWTTLPSDISNSASYGGFIGYNIQYDRLVLGLDLAYSHFSSLQTIALDGLSRIVTTSDNVEHDVTIAAQSSLKLIDYAAVRARAGYVIGQFLPYAMLGAAVGRFNYSTTATVTDFWTPSGGSTVQFGPITNSEGKDNAFAAGFVAGLGVDVAILPNVFLRGEWEFVAFMPINGINNNINTGRAGIGLRF